MRYLHTMIRVSDLENTLDFFCDKLGMVEVERHDYEQGRFTLVFLAAPEDEVSARDGKAPMVEITYNWDPEAYSGGRNFGHLAYQVDDIYALCQDLIDKGVIINRPPRDGHMAFIRKVIPCHPVSPGRPWKIRVSGRPFFRMCCLMLSSVNVSNKPALTS